MTNISGVLRIVFLFIIATQVLLANALTVTYTPIGTEVNSGYWNSTNTGATVSASNFSGDGTAYLTAIFNGAQDPVFQKSASASGGSATFTLTSNDIEQIGTFGEGKTMVLHVSAFFGADEGNSSDIVIDQTAPQLDTRTIVSNNANNTALAKTGNKITVALTANENIQTPTVTFTANDNAAASTIATSGQTGYSASYFMQGTDAEGNVSFKINFKDLAGNAGTQVTTTTNGSSVVFDRTLPTLSATMSSNNTSSTRAKTGDQITLAITASEQLYARPTITIATMPAGSVLPNSSASSYEATYTMTGSEAEGNIAYEISSFTDLAGNAGVTTAGNGGVTYDKTVPSLTNVGISSNGAIGVTYAKPGNVVSLTFTQSESIKQPTVTIAGEVLGSGSVTNDGSGNWTAVKTMDSDDPSAEPAEAIAFSIAFADLAGNNGVTVSAITTGQNVTFDKTDPTLTSVTIASDNSTPSLAKSGDEVTVSFTSDENLLTPTVTIAEQTASVSGSNSSWTASYTMTSAQSEGTVSFSIAYSDLHGNAGTTVTTITSGDNVTFDRTNPSLTTVTIASDNANASNLAIVGDRVTVTITADEPVVKPTVAIAGTTIPAGNVTGSGQNWSAFHDMLSGNPSGTVSISINYTDLSGNSGTEVTAITGGSNVTFDRTAPTLTAVTIESDNDDASRAKVGDQITLTIEASESILEPSVTIAGKTATVVGSGTDWTATYTMTSSETAGTVTCNIAFEDQAGNNGTAVTSVTDASSVTFDKTAPTLTTVAIVSNNANNTALAKSGDQITVSFTASEGLNSAAVMISGGVAAVSNVGNNYTAVYTMTTASNNGTITFSIAFEDLTGNAGTTVTTTTNGSAVTFDKTAPQLTTVSYTSSNGNSSSVAKTGDDITLTIVANEDLSGQPAVKISSQNANVTTTDAQNYSAVYTMQGTDTEGAIGINITNFYDLAGNAGTAVTALTSGGSITFDRTAPSLTTISIASNNSINSARAKVGDEITLTIQSDEALHVAPTMTIAGNLATVTGSDVDYSGTYTMQNSNTEGTVSLSVSAYTDLAGNVGDTETAITTGSNITFDKTAPTLTTLSIASDNSDPTLATIGDIVTLSIGSSEPIQTPTVALYLDGSLLSSSTSGSNQTWSTNYTIQSSDDEGTVTFSVTFNDVYGNSGTVRTTTNDGSSVTFDKTGPTLTTVTIVSDNSASSALAIPGDEITLSIQANEPITAPTVTIAGNAAAITVNNSQNYDATYTMTTAASEGAVSFIIAFSDVTGNVGTAVTTTTNGSSVTFDKTAPTITLATVYSENDNTSVLAAVGDTVTVNLVSDQPLAGVPAVTFLSNAANYYVQNSTTDYSVSYIVQSGDAEGDVTFTISNYTDVGGNAGVEVNNSTDESIVTIDKTAPVVDEVTSVTPQGGGVNTTYWNSANTRIVAAIPLEDTDDSQIGGSVRLQAKSGSSGSSFANIGSAVTVTEGSVTAGTINITVQADETAATGLEEIVPFLENNYLYFRAVYSDIVGNTDTGPTSTVTLLVDQTLPTADLTYSHTLASADTVVEIEAQFSEDLVTAPTITIGEEVIFGREVGTMTIVGADASLWTYSYTVPDGAQYNGDAEVYIDAQDIALNVTTLADTTLVIDNTAPGYLLEYANLTQPTLVNLGKGGDDVQITVTFTEPVTIGTRAPKLDVEYADSTDDSIVGLVATYSSNGDSVWVFDITLPTGEENSGDLINLCTAWDLAGNPAYDASLILNSIWEPFKLDNTPPAYFTTGATIAKDSNVVAGWINSTNDTIQTSVTTQVTDIGGQITLSFAIPSKMDTTGAWVSVGSADAVISAGAKTLYRRVSAIVNALNNTTTVEQGDTILTRARKYDKAGNYRQGRVSANKLVYDITAPSVSSTLVWNESSPDTLFSEDSIRISWGQFNEPNAATASGISNYQWQIQREGSGPSWSDYTDWSSSGLEIERDTVLALTHGENYRINVRAWDVAGNLSGLLTSSGFLRSNSAPVIASVNSRTLYEDIAYLDTIEVSDPDLVTLNGDSLAYFLVTTHRHAWSPATPAVISTSGFISWIPTPQDTGIYNFEVYVDDDWGFSDTLEYVVTVLAVNDTPIVDFNNSTVVIVEDSVRTIQVNLDRFISDEDNAQDEIEWYNYAILDTNDIPFYPVPNGYNNELARATRAPTVLAASLNSPVRTWAADPKVAIEFDTVNDSNYAVITADTNYYGAYHRLVFYARDPDGAGDQDTLLLDVEPRNDAPVITTIADKEILENDSLLIDLGEFTYDIDDSALTFSLTALTNAGYISFSANNYISTALGDTIVIKPQELWSDSTVIRVIVTDGSAAKDTVTFVLDILRVDRPHLTMALVQNSAFTNYLEIIVNDTIGMTVDCQVSIETDRINLDTISTYTYIGRTTIEQVLEFTVSAYAEGLVGDTTITRDAAVVLARSRNSWGGSSRDGAFSISGEPGAVIDDQYLLVVDTSLFSSKAHRLAKYRMGALGVEFDQPVAVMLDTETDNRAIYRSTNGADWEELPSLTRDGRVVAWTARSGYFGLGPSTLVVPQETALHNNFPNPFNPATTIIYDLGFFDGPAQRVVVKIYDLLGRQVLTLYEGQQSIGQHTLCWDGRNRQGAEVASGVYFIQMRAGKGFYKTQKIMLLR